MNDAVFNLGSLSIYGFGLLSVFAYLWGAFVFYKKAIQSHYEERLLLDSIVIAAFWAFIGGRLVYALFNPGIFWGHWSRVFLYADFPGMDQWGVLLGILGGLFLIIRKIKGRYFDWFDLMALGINAGMAVFLAGVFLMSLAWYFAVAAGLSLIAFLVFWNLEDHYRTFEWYRGKRTAARSGLVAGLSLTTWSLVLLLPTLAQGKGNWMVILWSVILFVGGGVMVYIRSGRTVQEDIKTIFKYGRKQKN